MDVTDRGAGTLRIVVLGHHEDDAGQCRSDGKGQDKGTQRHGVVRICAVSGKNDDARWIDQGHHQREQEPHCDAHGGVGDELCQPGGRDQSWRLPGAHGRPRKSDKETPGQPCRFREAGRFSEIFVSFTWLTSATTKPVSPCESRVGEPPCSILQRPRCCALSSMSCAKTSRSSKHRREPVLLPRSWKPPPKASARSRT